MSRGVRAVFWDALAVVCLSALATGCGSTTDDDGESQSADAVTQVVTPGAEAGRKLLLRMTKTYREAPAYRDRAKLKLAIRSPGEDAISETFPIAVEFVRPGKIRIEAYSATVVSDGHSFIAKVDLPESNNFDGQIVELDAPATISAQSIAAIDGATGGALSGGIAPPFQLDLLLAEQIDEGFEKAQRVAIMPSQQLGGRDCHCVQIEYGAGRAVWWIDKENYMLRRFEYPVDEIARQFRRNPSEISVVADFDEAEFAAPTADRFALAVPDDAQRVKYLVPPPVLPPDKLVGEPSPAFAFDTFSGGDFADKAAGKLTAESLRGKSAMLLFWTSRDAPVLDAFDKLAKKYQDRTDVALVAVLTDPSDAMTDAQLRQMMTQKKPAFVVARADHATAVGMLAPTAAVYLSREGVVEDAILLDAFEAVRTAPETLDTLLAGKPWHPRALGRIEDFRRQYAERLVLAKTGRVPPVEAAAKTPPQRHRLVSLWKQTELKHPGNILVSPLTDTNLLVLDGARTVVEVDASGTIGNRHELQLPDAGDVGFLRVGKSPGGKTFFVGSRVLQPKLYVFDDQWRVTAAYPSGPIPADENNPEVSDVQVADVDLDGTSDILVGYNGIQGVHLVSPDGRRRWSNRAVSAVSRIAVAPLVDEQPAIFVASFNSPTAVLDASGEERGRWQPESGEFSILSVGGAPAHSGSAATSPRPFFGVTMARPNQLVALGLATDGAALWEYVLPPGMYGTQIQALLWGRLVGDADHWIIAAPDGSIHLLAADGKPLDYFNLGELPTGIAATTIDGKPALVAATKNGVVEAFRLEAAETIRPAE
ncbi:MAG: hypothetical protein WD875_17435 [Pirellulales bacterium]